MEFKRGQDPYNKLSIGPKIIIDNWFKQQLPNVDYTIDDKLNIMVDRSLYIWKFTITKLPNNLTVNGSLYLAGSNVTKLTNNLTVNGDLYLSNSIITELGNNLTVKGKYIKGFKKDRTFL